jgi:hypothetical protein
VGAPCIHPIEAFIKVTNIFSLTRLLILVLLVSSAGVVGQSQQRSPMDTVREFYKAMRERKFREAFALSIYRPAIEGLTDQEFQALRSHFKDLNDAQFAALRPNYAKLSPQEFDDLRPDFEAMAANIPEKVDLTGEQISGDAATVFVRVKDTESGGQAEPVSLIRVDGKWVIGDRANQSVVHNAGKNFFFNARIDTHHQEVQNMLQRISLAQVVYGQQHDGQYGDLAALIAAGLVPKDLEGTQSTGYRFRIVLTPDRKAWSAAAEPAQYGRTGKLSFLLVGGEVKNADLGGKPLAPTPAKP